MQRDVRGTLQRGRDLGSRGLVVKIIRQWVERGYGEIWVAVDIETACGELLTSDSEWDKAINREAEVVLLELAVEITSMKVQDPSNHGENQEGHTTEDTGKLVRKR